AILFIRFGKPKPTTYGIPRGTGRFDRRLLWWTLHYSLLYVAIALSIAGASLAIWLSGGFSGTLHAWFGSGAILFGMLQIISAWFRGSHGGKQGVESDPQDRSTWGGDHFDMTAKRRWFETYHKTAGYITIVMAVGAVASGLWQFWMPGIAIAFILVMIAVLILATVLQAYGLNVDTYKSVYGNHPDHPFNKKRSSK
ncbi:MAG TPA: hypothetical protein QGI39_13650, partial [Gammaproteobacteria bacterium]|nr:hypothetical protein [Gammaproteobacteria bacterium]